MERRKHDRREIERRKPTKGGTVRLEDDLKELPQRVRRGRYEVKRTQDGK